MASKRKISNCKKATLNYVDLIIIVIVSLLFYYVTFTLNLASYFIFSLITLLGAEIAQECTNKFNAQLEMMILQLLKKLEKM